jgi:hypothetical protein
MSKDKKYKDLDMIRFYEYSAKWWAEYQTLGYGNRQVKIYAESEDKLIFFLNLFIRQYLPVFCFIT